MVHPFTIEHTPGPWFPTLGRLIRVVPSLPGEHGRPVCGVHLRGKFTEPERARLEAIANANLISASPDMKRVLDKLLIYSVEGDYRIHMVYEGTTIVTLPPDSPQAGALLKLEAARNSVIMQAKGGRL